jgi:hypothetical protein
VKKDKTETSVSKIARFLTPMEGTRLFNMAAGEGMGESVTPQKGSKGGRGQIEPRAVGKAKPSPKPSAGSKKAKAAPTKIPKAGTKAPRPEACRRRMHSAHVNGWARCGAEAGGPSAGQGGSSAVGPVRLQEGLRRGWSGAARNDGPLPVSARGRMSSNVGPVDC